MALNIGDIGATAGMAAAVYNQIRANIEPDMPAMSAEDLEAVRDGWRKLAHGIATGVVAHLQANLEVRDAATDATPVRDVNGQTDGTDLGGGPHVHDAGELTVTLDNLFFR